MFVDSILVNDNHALTIFTYQTIIFICILEKYISTWHFILKISNFVFTCELNTGTILVFMQH